MERLYVEPPFADVSQSSPVRKCEVGRDCCDRYTVTFRQVTQEVCRLKGVCVV